MASDDHTEALAMSPDEDLEWDVPSGEEEAEEDMPQVTLGSLMPVGVVRPSKRSDCKDGERPCPWVGCKFHLYLDVNPETGTIKLNFPDVDPDDMKDSCALDIAERGGITLEEVGAVMNLTRERIRQVEVRGLLRLRMTSASPEEIGANLFHRPGISVNPTIRRRFKK